MLGPVAGTHLSISSEISGQLRFKNKKKTLGYTDVPCKKQTQTQFESHFLIRAIYAEFTWQIEIVHDLNTVNMTELRRIRQYGLILVSTLENNIELFRRPISLMLQQCYPINAHRFAVNTSNVFRKKKWSTQRIIPRSSGLSWPSLYH